MLLGSGSFTTMPRKKPMKFNIELSTVELQHLLTDEYWRGWCSGDQAYLYVRCIIIQHLNVSCYYPQEFQVYCTHPFCWSKTHFRRNFTYFHPTDAERDLLVDINCGCGIVIAWGTNTRAAILFFVVLFVIVLNTVGEYSSQDAGNALCKMAAPRTACIRDGREMLIEAAALVVGDVGCH